MTTEPIAVVGVSALFAESPDAAAFWQNIVAGRDLIKEVPETHWLARDYYDANPLAPDKTYCNRGSFLSPVAFDALKYGIPPSIVPATDTSQLLSLMMTDRLLEDINQDALKKVDRERISIILGVTGTTELTAHMSGRMSRPQWEQGLREAGFDDAEVKRIADRIAANFVPWQESTFPGLLGNVVAGRIANRFDLGGTNCVVDAACASSLAALSMAVNELHQGQSDLAIVGGIDTLNDPLMYLCFSKTPALSPTGDCRPFSEQADGTILGEGIALIALRRLKDAERDGDHIYAVIRGVGTSSDGRSKSVYAPRSEGQAKALRRAYSAAGYSARTVELVEAHGTATKAGDVAEIGGLTTVFGEAAGGASSWCAVGSVKSQIGHSKAAAGLAGVMKAVLSLHHKVLPPTIKVEKPNPKLALEQSPFFVNTQPRPWIRGEDHPRRASVSSFGFGGSNFHVTLEEYVGPSKAPVRMSQTPTELVVFSGRDAADVSKKANELVASASSWPHEPAMLRRLAHLSHQAFKATDAARLAIVAGTVEELSSRLGTFASSGSPKVGLRVADGVYFGLNKKHGKIAWLFPGQGSQYVGMGQDLATAFSEARQAWDLAVDVPDLIEAPLHQFVFPPNAFSDEEREAQETRLRETDIAQPSLGVTGLAAARVLKALNVPLDTAAGHSFGELTALAATGSISERSLLTLAKLRGVLMKSADKVAGTMTAVRSDAATIGALLKEQFPKVFLANDNSPKQIVVGGPTADIVALEEELGRRKVSYKRLNVSAAFHSPALQDCADQFAAAVARHLVGTPEVAVYANTTAERYPSKLSDARALLANQLAKPVRFRESLAAMYASGVRTFVEVGPGAVLTGLVGECLAGHDDVLAVAIDRKGQHGVTNFWHALGQLAVVGAPIDWTALTADFTTPAEPVAVDPKRSLQICGANYGKPYPRPGQLQAPIVVVSRPPEPKAAVATAGASGAGGTSRSLTAANVSSVSQSVASTGGVASSQATPSPVTVSSNRVSQSLPSTNGPQRSNSVTKVQPMNSPQRNSGTAPAAPPLALSDANTTWLLEVQRQTAEAHQVYLQTMAQAHMAFLQSMVPTGNTLPVLANPVFAPQPVARPAAAPVTPSVRDVQAAAAYSAPAPVAPRAAQPIAAARPATPPAPVAAQPVAKPAVQAAASKPAPVAAPAASGSKLRTTLLEVVAEKTGYPVEVLDMDLDIEAGLGIDSIKRVEILSALMERHPELPEMQLSELGGLRTLGDLLNAVAANEPAESAAPAAPVAKAQPVAAPAASSAAAPSGANLRGTLLEVVAEKTGYPVEVLDMDLDIEAGLGIDSIKRVEILSALMERHPELPEMQLSELGGLRTLGDLLNAVASNGPAAPAAAPAQIAEHRQPAAAAVATAPPPRGGTGLDVERILLEVVSEKTGYPVEVLDLDMEIEASLGIDSIKRVEILSAVMELVPGLPEVQMSELGGLRTLRDVLSKLDAAGGLQPVVSPAGHAVTQGGPLGNLSGPGNSGPETHVVADEIEDPNSPIRRLAVRLERTNASGFALPVLTSGVPLAIVVGDAADKFVEEVAVELTTRLADHGLPAIFATTVPAEARAVIHLGGLREASSWKDGADLLRNLLRAAQVLAKVADQERVALVTVQDTGGRFGINGLSAQRAWVAGVTGVAKTAAQEWPQAAVKALDVERTHRSPAQVAEAIEQELFSGGAELEVGLPSDGTRWTLRTIDARVGRAPTLQLTQNDVILVSGGARGVTARTVIELAKATRAKFVLLGRTELNDIGDPFPQARTDAALKQAVIAEMTSRGEKPVLARIDKQVNEIVGQREIRETLKQIKAAGAQVCYIAVDIRDQQAVSQLVKQIGREWGPIKGVIHGAGVLADKRIVDKTQEQFDRVLETKVEGMQAMLEATREEPLQLIAFFSSVAGRYGNAGQCDYAAGNEILNKMAQAERTRRGGACQVKSINWGPWDGGMVTPALKALFQKRGIEPIPLDIGARMFVEEVLRGDPSQVEVVIGGDSQLRAVLPLQACDNDLQVIVSPSRHSFLDDHRVKDVPVLPMVLALEWFVRAAHSRHADMTLLRCRDLQVLRGVPLTDFENGRRFRIECQEIEVDNTIEMQMELRSLDGTKHYRCTVEMAGADRKAQAKLKGGMAKGEPWPWSIEEAYDRLFHGPDFQVLRSLDGVSDQGAQAKLTGIRSKLWHDGPWHTDAPAIDGAMQLALLWSLRRTGRSSLPTSVKAVRLLSSKDHEPMMKCEVLAKRIGLHTHSFDVRITTESGEPILELEDLEMALMA